MEKGGEWAPIRAKFEQIQAKWAPIRAKWAPIQAKWAPIQAKFEQIRAKWAPIQAKWAPIRAKWAPIRAKFEQILAKWAPTQAIEKSHKRLSLQTRPALTAALLAAAVLLPLNIARADDTIHINNPIYASSGWSYDADAKKVLISRSGNYVVTGETSALTEDHSGGNCIEVAHDVTANITLSNASIVANTASPISLLNNATKTSGANVNLLLEGNNSLTVTYENPSAPLNSFPGIHVPKGASLIIEDKLAETDPLNPGSLTITGAQTATGVGSAAIGTFHSYPASFPTGNIEIRSGRIIATGGNGAAAIGGGCYNNAGNIRISGGYVTATAGNGAAAIGGGYLGSGATDADSISITGGTLYARTPDNTGISLGNGADGGQPAAIGGGGFNSNAGNIRISGGTICAFSINGPGIGAGNDGNDGAGSITITTADSHTQLLADEIGQWAAGDATANVPVIIDGAVVLTKAISNTYTIRNNADVVIGDNADLEAKFDDFISNFIRLRNDSANLHDSLNTANTTIANLRNDSANLSHDTAQLRNDSLNLRNIIAAISADTLRLHNALIDANNSITGLHNLLIVDSIIILKLSKDTANLNSNIAQLHDSIQSLADQLTAQANAFQHRADSLTNSLNYYRNIVIYNLRDTLYLDTLIDTLYLDTLWLDTLYRDTLVDILYLDTLYRDTLYLYRDTLTDTLVLHDTIDHETVRIETVYIVIDSQTGATTIITDTIRAISYATGVMLEGLIPAQPYTIYNINGQRCYTGTASTAGRSDLLPLPPATYLLHQQGVYKKFVR